VGSIQGLKRSLVLLLVLAAAIEVFTMLAPFFLSWVIDHAIVSADRDMLLTLVIGFGLLLLVRTAVSAIRGWLITGMSASLKVQASANLFSHLVSLPAAYFESRHLGDVLSRFGSHQAILDAITQELVLAVLDGAMVAITLAIMFYLAPDLAWVVLAGACLYGLLRWTTYGPLRRASAEAVVWRARGESHLLETMRGIRTIKLKNGQEHRRTQWLNLLVETVNRQLVTQKLQVLFANANLFLLGGLALAVVGLLVAFIAYKDQFISRISGLIDRAAELAMLRIHAERLADIALTAPESRGTLAPASGDGREPLAVCLRNIRFRYSEFEPWILDGVSLDIAAGESIVICGPSGGGKSTLFKLICGLLKPQGGDILIDGEPLDRMGLENFRNRIGVVLQDDQLFTGSIAENISFFSERRDHEKIVQCAKRAGVHDDIEAMAMGYETLMGDMGTALSGGQKQRVLLARALYGDPQALLLDEASSHLDVAREVSINAALKQLPMTRIVIAHRLETINAASRVVVLQNGKIEDRKPEPGLVVLPTHGKRQIS
jgi:ATP-binding cassette, subfamily B, bacterial CvaB/MchF/RaxB